MVIYIAQSIADRRVIGTTSLLQSVNAHFKQTMPATQHERRLMSAFLFIGVGKLLRGLTGKSRLKGEARRPNRIGRQADGAISERHHPGGKFECLSERDNFRPIALLGAAIP